MKLPVSAEWEQVTVAADVGDCTHLIPVDDLVGHELDPDCVCGPYWQPVTGGYLVAHWPLDRRP